MKRVSIQSFFKSMKKRTAIVLLIASLFAVYILFDSRGLIQRIRLSAKKASLEEKIAELRKDNAAIQAEIRKLQTDDREIERIARERYFMHRNGEKIIKVEPK